MDELKEVVIEALKHFLVRDDVDLDWGDRLTVDLIWYEDLKRGKILVAREAETPSMFDELDELKET